MVAAIVIGMGGNCKLLSARLQLKDYIKHGKETATIEVCLIKDGDRNISHFKRSFGRRGKGSYQVILWCMRLVNHFVWLVTLTLLHLFA